MVTIIKKIENSFFSKKTHVLDTAQMWFLTSSEEELRADKSLDAETLGVLLSLRRDGFAILPGNIDTNLCDAVIRDFDVYCASNPEARQYEDEFGLHSRLALFHYKSRNALRVSQAPRTLRVLNAAFRRDATLVGSLLFEKGSTQDIHRDTPAFFTNPLNHFLGVWNALEDIQENSGELCYYKGGHEILPDADLYADKAIGIDNYFSTVEKACQIAGLKRQLFLPKKGDTLIWLPQLPHGGAPRIDKALSRRSIVFHFIPNGIPIHGANDFFNQSKAIHVGENYSTKSIDGVRMIDMGETRFYHNHSEGNFTEG
jgi:phytanoyl-CoA hydroxylase